MLIFNITILLIVIGVIVFKVSDSFSDFEAVGFVLATTGSIFFIGLLIALPIIRMDCMSKIKGFEAVRETILIQRENGIEIERTALIVKMVEYNKWLKEIQYQNSTFLDIFIPDEIDNLEPLK